MLWSVELERQLDLFHDPVGLGQELDALLIVYNVLERQRPALKVFQPFLRWLICISKKAGRFASILRATKMTPKPK
jgi:hypothetical protein